MSEAKTEEVSTVIVYRKLMIGDIEFMNRLKDVNIHF
ncbi:hypothetical protein ABIA51_003940 [Erwinia aphidicola]